MRNAALCKWQNAARDRQIPWPVAPSPLPSSSVSHPHFRIAAKVQSMSLERMANSSGCGVGFQLHGQNPQTSSTAGLGGTVVAGYLIQIRKVQEISTMKSS